MAKLYGVKTLDMVNGEIIKISYDGAEYTLTTEEAVRGDILLALIGRSYIDNGAFYTCYATGGPSIMINDNDMQLRLYHRHDFKVFRKVSADNPTQQKDANGMEKEVYKPQEGDIVVVTDDRASSHVVGNIGKITEVDGGTYRVTVPGMPDRGNWLIPTRFRKATPAEVKEYEEAVIDATFKVGDYVKIVKSLRDNNGAICVIEDKLQYLGGFTLRHISGKFPNTKSFATYDQIELATEAEVAAAKKPKLKSGDFIKFAEDGLDITAGKVYKVQQDSDGNFYVLDDYGSKDYRIGRGSDFEIVPESEAKWLKIGRKVNEYRVGDIVRLLNGGLGGLSGYEGIITKITDKDYLYRLEKPDFVEDEVDTWYQADDIELIAPVESTLN